MQVAIGSYWFPVNAVELTRSCTVRTNQEGRPLEETWRYDAAVTLVSHLTDKIAKQQWYAGMVREIYNATSVVGADLVLFDDNGFPSDLALRRAGALQAPHRVAFANPEGGKSEHAGKRLVTFSFEARYPSPGSIGSLVSFSQTFRVIGDGGPTKIMAVCQDVVVEQETRRVSLCMAYEQGQAVGYLGFPRLGQFNGAPFPTFPRGFRPNKAEWSRTTPQQLGIVSTDFTLTWSYYSESGTPYKLV